MSKILNFQGNNTFVYFIILSIILLGFILRFYNIGYENLWFDEIFSFWVTDPSLSFTDTFSRIRSTESIPFLYFYPGCKALALPNIEQLHCSDLTL